jgi:hypothetical protein
MREGQVVDFMVDFSSDNGTLQQIAKLKAGIRAIAQETGHHHIEVENEVKQAAGLYNEVNKVHKSFGDCSREELSDAIQVMIEVANQVGINLN